MTDRDSVENAPETFGDLPMQPTGSGVADLEIACEQMKLADEADLASTSLGDVGGDMTPFGRDGDGALSEAHPS